MGQRHLDKIIHHEPNYLKITVEVKKVIQPDDGKMHTKTYLSLRKGSLKSFQLIWRQ